MRYSCPTHERSYISIFGSMIVTKLDLPRADVPKPKTVKVSNPPFGARHESSYLPGFASPGQSIPMVLSSKRGLGVTCFGRSLISYNLILKVSIGSVQGTPNSQAI